RPAFDEQQLEHLEAFEIAIRLPLVEDLPQRPRNRFAFDRFALAAARLAGRRLVLVELLVQHIAGTIRNMLQRMAAAAAQMVRELVRGDREQISLQFAAVVEVRQAVEEADESLLNDILARGAIAEPAIDEGQQPPLVARDQLVPGAVVAIP